MGLLDDAIREHMELKRLRGADPAVVAREERDALGPVVRERDGVGSAAEDEEERTGAHEGPEELAVEDGREGGGEERTVENGREGHAMGDGALGEDEAAGASSSAPARGADFANVGQETAELDMRTVLDEQHEAVDRAGQIDSADALHAHGENAHGEDPEKVDPEGVEDVLEETPEFLRDTPEQERLWFEQQGPRDFDFDG
jgi:hypothetical protein